MDAEDFTTHFGSWRGKSGRRSSWSTADAAQEEDSEPTDSDSDGEICEGLRERHPALHEWFSERLGGPADVVIVLVFLVSDALCFSLDESLWDSKVNFSSMMVMTCLASLAVSSTVSFALLGTRAVKQLTNLSLLWRFGLAALFFQLAWRLDADAYIAGTKPIVVKTLGYTYMPVSAVASWVIFRRGHGRLDWLALLIMTLAMGAFVLLRERCRSGHCESGSYSLPPIGITLVLTGVLLSCTASLICERIYKNRSFGLNRLGGADPQHYSVHKVYLDACALALALFVWCCPVRIKQSLWGMPYSTDWFGTWTNRNFIYVPAQVIHWWMAGLVAKRFSTVTKALIQSVATGVVIILHDPSHFSAVLVPDLCMFVIIILSALMWQTGRLNISLVANSFASDKVVKIRSGVTKALKDIVAARKALKPKEDKPPASLKDRLCGYNILIMYTLTDATRTMLYTVSVGQSMITPQSFSLVMNFAMLCLSNVLLFTDPPEGQKGKDALREAWTARKLLKFLPCGFLFALTSAFMSMAMGLGISGSLNVVIGKIYLPICAFASRFLLGKFYMWLEWFAIIILTLDASAFGFLKNMGAGGRATSKLAILCCALSATSSAMSSMVMEKLMKSEPGKPFMMQKLRSDFACFVCSFLFLPVMGWLSDPEHFAKGAYWRYRPITNECNSAGSCGTWGAGGVFSPWDGGGDFAYWNNGTYFVNSTSAHGVDCSCAKGVFACWTSIAIYLMLVVAVFYGFITGLVVTKFGGVMRAIADNFSLLLVYGLGDPLMNGTKLTDMSLNLTALILPLSSQAFSDAAAELQRVQTLKQELQDSAEDEEEFVGAQASGSGTDSESDSSSDDAE